jgi:hypothetical protein
VIFATTVQPEALTPAEIGVFKYVLPVFYGDIGIREVQLLPYAELVALEATVDLREIAALTEGWSGEELGSLISRAAAKSSRVLVENDIRLLAQRDIRALAQSDIRVLAQSDIIDEHALMRSNIIPAQRQARTMEIVKFAKSHGTSQYVLDDILGRFSKVDDSKADVPPETLWDKWKRQMQNYVPIVVVLLIITIVLALGGVADAITKIETLFHSFF